ncbi:MAG: putative transport system permease protein [Pseudonocardiales bacterium]|nr:putative transport system permease protein [Pseudonocardiales bacterium]
MNFVTAWLRLELPRRWRSVAVLTLLIAVASATVMAALAGARRGASALERLQDRTKPATSAVFTNTANYDWNRIRALPEVEALTTFVIDYAYTFEGYPDNTGGFPLADAEMLTSIETPVVFTGRMFDATRDDEVVVTRRFMANYHKHLGDTVVLNLPTPSELAEQSGSGPDGAFTGPHLRMRIVGVIGSPWLSDEPGATGFIQMSPGVVAKHAENTIGPANSKNLWNFVSALVRLRGGEADLPQFRRDVVRVSEGRTDIEVWNLPGEWRSAQREVTFEARCLLAFGAAAFVAALFLVGQAVARYAAASTTELRTMRALGVTPGQAIAAAATGPAIAGVVGTLLGVASAYLVSQFFPFGTADLIEPAPGLSADWLVFAPGLVLVSLLVCAGAVAAAWFSLAAARRNRPARRSTAASVIARWGLPVPVIVGTRFALEPGRGRTAVPVRPALIGAVTGVLGILAAFTFSHGVSDVVSHPERFGQTHQLEAFIGANSQDFLPADKLLSIAAANSDVIGIDDARQAVATGPGGSVSVYSYTGGAKAISVVLLSGRMPSSASEVALAPRTLAAQHVRVGDQVKLSGDKASLVYTVTGSGLVPEGPRNGYADGAWIGAAGYDAIFKGHKFHAILVSLRPGANTDATIAALAKATDRAVPEAAGFTFSPPDPPIEVAEIRTVRALPIVLGGFLALLAVGAVGHVLATAVRRRSHDVAVLRALGMTQWQCRWIVLTQASVLAVIGLLFGVPLGVALGRTLWRVVADSTPLQYVAPTAAWTLLAVVPAALLIANVLAAVPGRRAARLQISHILRTE